MTRMRRWLFRVCLPLAAGLLPFGAAAAADPAWLTRPEVPPEAVTQALNDLRALPTLDAAARLSEWQRVAITTPSKQGERAATFLIAAAHEQIAQKKDLDEVRKEYEAVKAAEAAGPYAVSASVRLRLLNVEPAKLEAEYQKIADEEGAGQAQGWFLKNDQWTYSTQRQAYLEMLADAHAGDMSVRILDYLKGLCPWPGPYAYLFMLLLLTLGSRILVLPFLYKGACLAVQVRRLSPAIQRLQNIYANDPIKLQTELQALYQANGVNPLSGCLLAVIDLAFVIWALVALSNYAPRMVLDGSRFLWIDDVTRYNTWIVLLWVVLSVVQPYLAGTAILTPKFAAQLACGSVLSGGVILAVAWWWQWPAHAFVFWMLLLVVGVVTMRALIPIARPPQRAPTPAPAPAPVWKPPPADIRPPTPPSSGRQ